MGAILSLSKRQNLFENIRKNELQYKLIYETINSINFPEINRI